MALQQSYYCLDNNDLLATESWLCGTADILAVYTGRANWTDWSSSDQWQIDRTQGTDSELRWSIPILANGGTLAAAAAKNGDDKIIVRVGEEFNGDWMPWIAAAKEPDYIQAYRNSVDAFRSVSDVFEWNVNAGSTRDRSKRYPADNYFDTVGMDFYWDNKNGITDPVQAFNYYKNTRYGPQWPENFTTPRGKQSAHSEWGVNSPNAGNCRQYIHFVRQWFDSHNFAYQTHWNSGHNKLRLFISQLRFLYITPLSDEPFWSLAYEFWFYVILGAVQHLRGRVQVASA